MTGTGEFRVIGNDTVTKVTIEFDRQRHEPGDARDAAHGQRRGPWLQRLATSRWLNHPAPVVGSGNMKRSFNGQAHAATSSIWGSTGSPCAALAASWAASVAIPVGRNVIDTRALAAS